MPFAPPQLSLDEQARKLILDTLSEEDRALADVSRLASDAAMLRMANAGVTPVTTNTILSESHRTWNREDAVIWGGLYGGLVPEYQADAESFGRAQEAATKQLIAGAARGLSLRAVIWLSAKRRLMLVATIYLPSEAGANRAHPKAHLVQTIWKAGSGQQN